MKTYIDFKISKVIQMKGKYGFRIILFFADGTNQIRQIGGYEKRKDAESKRN